MAELETECCPPAAQCGQGRGSVSSPTEGQTDQRTVYAGPQSLRR
jgi:hypothetical protein